MASLAQPFQRVKDRIRVASAEHGDHTVQLLAVSKYQSSERIRALFDLGQRHFGENYLQEAEQKMTALASLPIEWHFIGPLQSNKARSIANAFHWVHSVDRLKVAQKLNDHRATTEHAPLNVLLQVNIDREPTKSGLLPEEALSLARAVDTMPHLTLRGLMAIPARRDTLDGQRQPFRQIRELQQHLQTSLPDATLDTLSMGMSADLEAAIAEGSTLVRIGTDLFGPRPPKP